MSSNDPAPEVARLFAAHWWAVLLRGIVAIAFGVLAFAWPGVSLATLVLLFGFCALVDGVFSLLTAIGGRPHRGDRWLLALGSVIGIWAGVVSLRAPALTAAVRLRVEISGEVWLALSGVLSILFAFMLMLRPAVEALGLVWVIAGYALILGVFEIMLGVELRGVNASLCLLSDFGEGN
jgi:uncharacterized membrane protein HdeD (DUF308 family)